MIKKPSVVQAGGHFSNLAVLTHFIPQASFCTPWKHQKSKGFSMFSRCIETTGMKWVKKKEIKEKKNNILQTFATLPHFSSKQSCSFNLSFGNGVNDLPIPGKLPQKYLVRYYAETSFALIATGRHSKNRLMISRSECLIPTTVSKNQKNCRELIGFSIA